MSRIYWASSMFTTAQREWNKRCAAMLRTAGHQVFLPQETPDNQPGHTPRSIDIFVTDTAAIMESDVVVGVLDDETIDSGVAAELGVAYAIGKRVTGLYTDIRQQRSSGSMYKNLYVIGLLECSLGVCTSMDELVGRLTVKTATTFPDQPELLLPDIDSFVERLEASYSPQWSSYAASLDRLDRLGVGSVIDYGCGTGRLAREVAERGSEIHYFGFDINDERVAAARQRDLPSDQFQFFSIAHHLRQAVSAHGEAEAAVLCSFVLHDVDNTSNLAALLSHAQIRHLVVLDITSDDLPVLTSLISRAIGRPPIAHHDARMSIGRFEELTDELNLRIRELEPLKLSVSFNDPEDVVAYCELFGLLAGDDIPFEPDISTSEFRMQLRRVLESVEFPLQDTRLFVSLIAEACGR